MIFSLKNFKNLEFKLQWNKHEKNLQVIVDQFLWRDFILSSSPRRGKHYPCKPIMYPSRSRTPGATNIGGKKILVDNFLYKIVFGGFQNNIGILPLFSRHTYCSTNGLFLSLYTDISPSQLKQHFLLVHVPNHLESPQRPPACSLKWRLQPN